MELLVEIRDGLKDLKIANQTEDTVHDQATTLEELEQLEESLKSTEERQKLVGFIIEKSGIRIQWQIIRDQFVIVFLSLYIQL